MKQVFALSLFGSLGIVFSMRSMDDDIEGRMSIVEQQRIKQSEAQRTFESLSDASRQALSRFGVVDPEGMRRVLDEAEAYQAHKIAARNRCIQISLLTVAVAAAAGGFDYATGLLGFETHVARQAQIGLAMTLGKTLLGRGVHYLKRPHTD